MWVYASLNSSHRHNFDPLQFVPLPTLRNREMQFFQCGVPSKGTLRHPLALECGHHIPAADAIAYKDESRDDDAISAFSPHVQERQQSNIQNAPRKLESTRTFDSLDEFLSPFEADLALDRTALYAQHDVDIDAKLREIMDFKTQATSIKASVERAADRFGKSAVSRSAARTSRKQDLSRIVEDLEAMATKTESPHMRIFCKLQQSERFKVFCFPRNAKSLVQLLRGVEEKLMIGVQAERPGRLLLVVNSRASFADDFVEIDDIQSIRDEDRFVFVPFTPEGRYDSDVEFEQLDLNYSASVSPQKQPGHLAIQKVPYNSPEYNTVSARFSRHSHHYPGEERHAPTESPKMRKEFEWLQHRNITGRTRTLSTASSGIAHDFDVKLLGESLCEGEGEGDRYFHMSPAATSFNWSLDENDLDEPLDEQSMKDPNPGNEDMLVPYLPSMERQGEYEMRDGPPEDIGVSLSPEARQRNSRGIEERHIAREMKKNRLAMEAKEREFEWSNEDPFNQDQPSDEVESDDENQRDYWDSGDLEGHEAPCDAYPSSAELGCPPEKSRSRSLRRSDEEERRRRSPPRSPSPSNNRRRSRGDRRRG